MGVAASALPMVFLAVFFVWPVANLIWRGLGDDISRLGEVLTGERFLRVIWFTLWQACASTALTAVIAAPLTWAIANRRFTGRRVARVLVTVPFVLPTVVVGGAFIAVMDRFGLNDGSLRLRHTVWAILIAHVFFNVAVVVRTVGGFWSQLDREQELAAQTLGATPWQAFREVTIPRLAPSVWSSLSIVFLFTFTSFAVVLLLGGPRRSTIETEIYRWAVTRGDISTAAALSVVQIAAVVALVALNQWLQGGVAATSSLLGDRAIAAKGRRQRVAVAAAVGGTGLFLAVPVVVLIERSLRLGGNLTFENYLSLGDRVRLLPVSALDAVANSLLFGLAAAGIALVIGGMGAIAVVHGTGAIRHMLSVGLLLPLGTSAVTLGFGVLITLDKGWLDLRSSWWIIPITQGLIGIPFVVRAVVPVMRAIDPSMREAAAVLGASPRQVRREIDLRIGTRALVTGVGFAFAISLGEFGATSFVGRSPDQLTVPLAIERLLGTPGDLLRGQAMALSVILMVVTAAVVLVGDRVHPGDGGVL